jgi:hypothetical protein
MKLVFSRASFQKIWHSLPCIVFKNWRYQKKYKGFFVEKNAPKLPDLEAKIPEIAVFTKIGSSRSPKYSKILKLFYFPLLQVAKFG